VTSANTLALLIGRIASALSTVVVLSIVARTRTADELGIVALGLSVGVVLAVLPEAGLTALLVRESARDPSSAGRRLSGLLLLRAIGLPLGIVGIGALVALAYGPDAGLIMLVALGPALQQISELGRAVFIAQERMEFASLHTIVENTAWAGAIATVLAITGDLALAFAAAAIVVAMAVLVALAMATTIGRVGLSRPLPGELGQLLRSAGPFAGLSTLAVVASRMDTFLVSLLLPNGIALAGIYYAITRLTTAAEYLPDALSRATYPRVARRVHEGAATVAEILRPAVRQCVAIGIPIPIGLVVAGGWLLGFLYGAEVAAYDWLLIALGVAIPFRYLSSLFGPVLTGSDRQTRRLRDFALAVATALVLDLILLSIVGLPGVAVATVASAILLAALFTNAVTGMFGRLIEPADVIAALAVSSIAGAVGLGVRNVAGSGGELLGGIVFTSIVILGWVAMWRGPSRWRPPDPAA
jgi:O-antigen/teichoic acid export membrane protein